jgi:hypothetical protein
MRTENPEKLLRNYRRPTDRRIWTLQSLIEITLPAISSGAGQRSELQALTEAAWWLTVTS